MKNKRDSIDGGKYSVLRTYSIYCTSILLVHVHVHIPRIGTVPLAPSFPIEPYRRMRQNRYVGENLKW